ncbi:hypothetical protein F4821DRAFT_38332 [Hypoxylon rubiginosum]|uniref:Uncharacterized protein n=1 Tax=Hypoxylon rubiginosum TaxID=110542 RepID=A0ACC0DC97_9PEZI|nr:hypothetical protein F4821DRAFT_38332 [Hypoxylon rubiginosum]
MTFCRPAYPGLASSVCVLIGGLTISDALSFPLAQIPSEANIIFFQAPPFTLPCCHSTFIPSGSTRLKISVVCLILSETWLHKLLAMFFTD